jgi:hypothetical protein
MGLAGMSMLSMHALQRRVHWALGREKRRLSRSVVAPNAALLGGVVLLLASASALRSEREQREVVDAAALARHAAAAAIRPVVAFDKARLDAFNAILPAHSDAVHVVRDLIQRAESEGLLLARGSYQTTIDASGDFVKFRVIHPVIGDSQDVHRYIVDSLRTHRALALESVRFKRSDGRAVQVEASIQWVLYTKAANTGAAP